MLSAHQRGPRATRRRVLAATLALALPAVRAADAPAPDLTAVPFEQLVGMEVFSASRFAQKVTEAPSTVIVITAADIRHFGWRTLADVARSVRGLNVNYDRNYSYLGARGFLRPGDYNTRFLLQIDGMRINDPVYDQAPLGGEFPLDLELIERIEFVPGTGSSMYGSNAFFGVINVVTRRPAGAAGMQATVEAGQAGYRRASASTGWHDAGGGNWLLSASRARTAGRDLYFPEFDAPDQNNGVAAGLDTESIKHLYFSATHGAWRVSALASERLKGIPTASWDQPFNTGGTYTRDTMEYLDVAWNARLRGGTRVDLRAFAGRTSSQGTYLYSDGGPVLNRDASEGQWWGVEAKAVAKPHAAHKLVGGIDLQRDGRISQRNFDLDPYAPYLDDLHTATRAGVYLQDEWTLRSGLLLNAGLRHDRNTGSAGVTSPRVALIVQPVATTTIKVISGTAYRAPNSYEKYYQFIGDGGQLANPLLQRERIRSHELALLHMFADGGRFTATVFRNRVDDLITQMPDAETGVPRFVNAGSATVRGLELEYERHFAGGAIVRASASRFSSGEDLGAAPVPGQDHVRASYDGSAAEASAAGYSQVNAPRTLAKLNAVLPAWRGWQLGVEAQYVGPRPALEGNAGGYTIANVNLVSDGWRDSEVALTAMNLFGRRYADPASYEHRQAVIPQDGRTVSLRLTWRF